MEMQRVISSQAATADDFQECIPHLRAFAKVLTGDLALADNLVETALIRALTGARPMPSPAGLKRWMFTILHVLHYSEPTRRARPAKPASSAGSRRAPPPADFAHNFWQLRDDQREVLMLDSATDLSRADVANILGCPPGMVELRAAMAKGLLQQTQDSDAPIMA